MGVNWRVNDAARLWTKARFKGKAEQVAGRGGLTDEYPSYTLVDTGVIYGLTERVEVYGSVYNVLDKDVDSEHFGRVLDGRRYSAGVTVNF